MLVGLPGLHVVEVDRDDGDALMVMVESAPAVMCCPACGVVAHSHGRRTVILVDTACFGRPTRLCWQKRTWTCPEPSCPIGVFTEQNEQIGRPWGRLTARACWWAIEQAPPRTRVGARAGPATRGGVEDGVGLDPTPAGGGRCR